MPKGNWKTLVLLGGVSTAAVILLALSLSNLRLLTWTGLAWCGALLLFTLAAGRFTVSVTIADGATQSRKSVADAFIFLAAMMYGPAPATILAGVDGFGSSRRAAD